MERSHNSKISKFVKGLRTLTRQKTIGKDRGSTLSEHLATFPPPENERCPAREKLPLPPPPVADAIYQLTYYHQHLISKDELTTFMSQYSLQEGYFLLRKSFEDPTSFTITVNHRCGLKHIRVVMDNGRFSLKDRSFDTIDEMVQFYSCNEIPNEESISGIKLRFPIRRPPLEFGEYISVSSQAPVPIPRDVPSRSNPPTPRKGSLIDPKIQLPVGRPSLDTVAPPAVRSGSVDSPKSSARMSSANDPNLSTKYTVPSRHTSPPSVNDPNLTMHAVAPSQPPDSSEISQDERCDCGLLMRETSLPLGWSIHVTQDSDTRNRPFFLSPDNETDWDLPLSVALNLSTEQKDRICRLGFDSHFKAAGFRTDGMITKPSGCSSKTEAIIARMNWVNNRDYESIREAMEKSTHGVQCKTLESSELSPNGDLQHPTPTGQEVTARNSEKLDDCAKNLSTDA